MSNPKRPAKPRKCVCGHLEKHHAFYSLIGGPWKYGCMAIICHRSGPNHSPHCRCNCKRYRPARVGKGRTK